MGMSPRSYEVALGFEGQDCVDRDELTGLASRSDLFRRMGAASKEHAVAVLDVDGLKTINQTFGYAAGDLLLKTIAARLRHFDEGGATLARLGGDRFVILLPSSDPRDVSHRVGLMAQALSESYSHRGIICSIAVSFGVAMQQEHEASFDELLALAQIALRAAKGDGGGCIRVFEPLMVDGPDKSCRSSEFALACARSEWRLQYQPQVNLFDRSIAGVEALLRWQHPTRGLLAPSQFIGELEDDPNAHAVGRWILERACRDLEQWRSRQCDVPRVAINLFGCQLSRPTFRADVMSILLRHGLAPSDVELEVTEAIALHSTCPSLRELAALRDDGVHIALDDFGTGFACLTTLRQLPLTCLKIDRSFVEGMVDEPKDLAVVRALISLGADLNLRIVAEGIETSAQARQLRDLRCQQAQGYYFSRPIDAPDVERFVDCGQAYPRCSA